MRETYLSVVPPNTSPSDEAVLKDAGWLALMNLRFHSLGQESRGNKSKSQQRKLRRSMYRETMGDLTRLGSVSVLWWVLRPVFMWLLRKFIERLIDRYLSEPTHTSTHVTLPG